MAKSKSNPQPARARRSADEIPETDDGAHEPNQQQGDLSLAQRRLNIEADYRETLAEIEEEIVGEIRDVRKEVATHRHSQLTALAALLEEKAVIESDLYDRAHRARSTYVVFAAMLEQAVLRKREDLGRWVESRGAEEGGGDGGDGDGEKEGETSESDSESESDDSNGDGGVEGGAQGGDKQYEDRGRHVGGQQGNVVQKTGGPISSGGPSKSKEQSTTTTANSSIWDLIRDHKLTLGEAAGGTSIRVEIARDDGKADEENRNSANTNNNEISASRYFRPNTTNTTSDNNLKRKRPSHPLSRELAKGN